jgi:peptide/nickel transport system permease protein
MVNLDSSSMDVSRAMSPPSRENPFGTDYIGRDLLSRVLYGGRNTLYIAFSATLMAAAVGSLIGIVSGYYGGNIDFYVMRLMDILSSVPSFLLAIIVEVALGWGEGNFRYALAIAAVPSFARLLRPSVMGIMSSQYIEASRALGAGTAGIIYRHVVHNIAAPLLIQFTSSVANTILTCTILGYLGIGISPPTPEWGSLVYYGTAYLRNAPHIALFPSMAVTLTVLSLNILGNGLRDALDPGNNG